MLCKVAMRFLEENLQTRAIFLFLASHSSYRGRDNGDAAHGVHFLPLSLERQGILVCVRDTTLKNRITTVRFGVERSPV